MGRVAQGRIGFSGTDPKARGPTVECLEPPTELDVLPHRIMKALADLGDCVPVRIYAHVEDHLQPAVSLALYELRE